MAQRCVLTKHGSLGGTRLKEYFTGVENQSPRALTYRRSPLLPQWCLHGARSVGARLLSGVALGPNAIAATRYVTRGAPVPARKRCFLFSV